MVAEDFVADVRLNVFFSPRDRHLEGTAQESSCERYENYPDEHGRRHLPGLRQKIKRVAKDLD